MLFKEVSSAYKIWKTIEMPSNYWVIYSTHLWNWGLIISGAWSVHEFSISSLYDASEETLKSHKPFTLLSRPNTNSVLWPFEANHSERSMSYCRKSFNAHHHIRVFYLFLNVQCVLEQSIFYIFVYTNVQLVMRYLKIGENECHGLHLCDFKITIIPLFSNRQVKSFHSWEGVCCSSIIYSWHWLR